MIIILWYVTHLSWLPQLDGRHYRSSVYAVTVVHHWSDERITTHNRYGRKLYEFLKATLPLYDVWCGWGCIKNLWLISHVISFHYYWDHRLLTLLTRPLYLCWDVADDHWCI